MDQKCGKFFILKKILPKTVPFSLKYLKFHIKENLLPQNPRGSQCFAPLFLNSQGWRSVMDPAFIREEFG